GNDVVLFVRHELGQFFDHFQFVRHSFHSRHRARDLRCGSLFRLGGYFPRKRNLVRSGLHLDLIRKQAGIFQQREFDRQNQRGHGFLARTLFFFLCPLLSHLFFRIRLLALGGLCLRLSRFRFLSGRLGWRLGIRHFALIGG